MVFLMETGEVRVGICCERKIKGLMEDLTSCWTPKMESDF